MTDQKQLDPRIVEAIGKIETFVSQTTGEAPTPEETSIALSRYFVLKEILDFIEMFREENRQA